LRMHLSLKLPVRVDCPSDSVYVADAHVFTYGPKAKRLYMHDVSEGTPSYCGETHQHHAAFILTKNGISIGVVNNYRKRLYMHNARERTASYCGFQ